MKAQQYAQALYEAIHEVRPEDQDKVLDNMAKIMAQRGDLGMFDQVAEEYQKLDSKAHGIKEVEVTSAHHLNTKELIKDLNKIVGDKTEVKEKIDQNIIGGVVVRVDDTLIDASVRNSLENLRDLIAKD
ncbi:MAG: synthase delta subunit [Candidatus Doudnabacteria bacterium]|nr:synthase delta subunit [Candidatus Doudnabacteria bacterium]